MPQPNDPDLNDLMSIPDPFAASPSALADAKPNPEWWPASPTRSRMRLRRWVGFTSAVAMEAILVYGMGWRDQNPLSSWVFVAGIAIPFVSAAVLVALATREKFHLRVSLAWVLPAAFVAFAALTLASHGNGDSAFASIAACLVATTLFTAGPATIGLATLRHSFAIGASWRTAAISMAAGLTGVAAIRMHCANDAFAHVLIGHGNALVLVVVLMLTLGTRITRA